MGTSTRVRFKKEGKVATKEPALAVEKSVRGRKPKTIAHLSRYEAGKWTAIPRAAPSITPLPDYVAPLRLMTYNTHSGNSSPYARQSATALLVILQHCRLDIIALQEITVGFYARLLAENWVRQNWVVTSLTEFKRVSGDRAEGCVVLVKAGLVGRGSRVEFLRLDKSRDELGKALIVLKLHSGGREKLRIITSHFTSLPINAHLRLKQYTTTNDYLPEDLPCILLADFNNSTHLEISSAFPSLHDTISPQTDPFRDAPTFGELYPHIDGAPKSRPRKLRRIDRILIGGDVENVGCGGKANEGSVRVGIDPLQENGAFLKENKGFVYPSDHCGVLAVVRIC